MPHSHCHLAFLSGKRKKNAESGERVLSAEILSAEAEVHFLSPNKSFLYFLFLFLSLFFRHSWRSVLTQEREHINTSSSLHYNNFILYDSFIHTAAIIAAIPPALHQCDCEKIFHIRSVRELVLSFPFFLILDGGEVIVAHPFSCGARLFCTEIDLNKVSRL